MGGRVGEPPLERLALGDVHHDADETPPTFGIEQDLDDVVEPLVAAVGRAEPVLDPGLLDALEGKL